MSVEAIERFAGPPLAERAYVTDQARTCIVRPGSDDLLSLVAREMSAGHPEDISWDAWRREDGRWTVVATTSDTSQTSKWIYDPRSRSVHADDPVAHRLASADVVVPLRTSSATVTLIPELEVESAPTAVSAAAAEDADAAETPDAQDESGTAPAPPATAEPKTAGPSKSRKSRRASVPRWDEILFGAGQSDA
jgi:hypothetical protein